ncbi:hypothetical protein PWT90_10998 [Aphanocladium album]|nr:hypothetical protein PWT90_10998 [Aphanocladium album]
MTCLKLDHPSFSHQVKPPLRDTRLPGTSGASPCQQLLRPESGLFARHAEQTNDKIGDDCPSSQPDIHLPCTQTAAAVAPCRICLARHPYIVTSSCGSAPNMLLEAGPPSSSQWGALPSLFLVPPPPDGEPQRLGNGTLVDWQTGSSLRRRRLPTHLTILHR